MSEECTSGQPLVSPNYMCASSIEVSHTLPLSFSAGGWHHLVSVGNASALKAQGEALVLRSLFCSTHWGEKQFLFRSCLLSKNIFVSVISFKANLFPPLKFAFFILFRIKLVVFLFLYIFSFLSIANLSLQWFSSSWQIHGEAQGYFARNRLLQYFFFSQTRFRVGPRTTIEYFLKTSSGLLRKIFCDVMWWFRFVF